MKRQPELRDMARANREPLALLDNTDLMPLPSPFDTPEKDHPWTPLSPQVTAKLECGLDNTCAVSVPQPKSQEEEKALVAKFLSGLEKLFEKANNWTFLQPLLLTMEHCTRCQTCSDACHVFEASGRNELYRPAFRSEIMRRLYFKYVKGGGLVEAVTPRTA